MYVYVLTLWRYSILFCLRLRTFHLHLSAFSFQGREEPLDRHRRRPGLSKSEHDHSPSRSVSYRTWIHTGRGRVASIDTISTHNEGPQIRRDATEADGAASWSHARILLWGLKSCETAALLGGCTRHLPKGKSLFLTRLRCSVGAPRSCTSWVNPKIIQSTKRLQRQWTKRV